MTQVSVSQLIGCENLNLPELLKVHIGHTFQNFSQQVLKEIKK